MLCICLQKRVRSFLVAARDDLSGWIEARATGNANSLSVAKFLWEDVICRYGCFGRLIVDGGPENKDLVEELAERYGIKRVQVSAYHHQANGMIERGHKPIVDALSKMTNGGLGNWMENLPAVLWADRSTVKPGFLLIMLCVVANLFYPSSWSFLPGAFFPGTKYTLQLSY